jgi:thymidine kinase
MPKLYFRYGCMGSNKSANLLMVAYNYEQQNKSVYTIKPKIDTRYTDMIYSRTKLSRKALCILGPNDIIDERMNFGDCVLVDECQFLSGKQIDQLRKISLNVPVICYGLRTDYRGQCFDGSKRLLEIADSIEEIKTTCVNCNHKAIINAKYSSNGGIKTVIKNGTSNPEIGSEEKYQPMCFSCWMN